MADGLCQCGCGQPAPIAQSSNAGKGWVRGQPMRFVRGHIGGINAAREYQKKIRILPDGSIVKWCTWCKNFRPIDRFDKSQHNPERLRSHCRDCHNEQEKANYKKNPAPYKRRAKSARVQARILIRARIARIKMSGCRACTEVDACCIEFHHVVGGDQPVSRCASVPEFERELVKCALLCANCHKKTHAGHLTITPEMMCTVQDGREEKAA